MKSRVVEEMRKGTVYGSDAAASKTFDEVFDAVKTVLHRDGQVRVPGFGIFKIKHRAERQGRNPRTGEAVRIAAHDAVTFKESKAG